MARTALSKPRVSQKGLTYSLSFDGVDDRAASASNVGLSGTAACSIVGWIKTQQYITSNGAGYITAGTMTGLTPGVGPALLVVGNTPGNRVQGPFINDDTAYIIPTETWVHLAVTYSGGIGGITMMYVNGKRNYVGATTGAATNGPIQIGGAFIDALGAYLYTKTKYGPFAVYSDVLTQTQIDNIYTNQDYPVDNAVGIYKLTEGTGTTIADTSGNGRDLTISGAPTWSSSDLPVITRQTASARSTASARTVVS